MATMMVMANSRKIRPNNPGMKASGMKTAASDRVIDKNGEGNFARAVEGGPVDRLPRFRPPNDVFQEDDRVIDQKADGESQRHQGEIVDRITEPPHRDERDEKRHRQRHHRNERVAGAAEENEDDKNDENESDHERAWTS